MFSGFMLILVYLGGFDGFQGQNVWQPVATCGKGLLHLKEDGRLQSCRFGGLDAWILEACRLEALDWIAVTACQMVGSVGMGRCSNTLDAQRGRRI